MKLTPKCRYINEDMRIALRGMEPDSIGSIVCDPPYGLGFMGKGWDHGVPGVEFWIEALRVLKPGGYLLAFGGTRTFHRLAVAIEDAGFEIRDCLSWMYGSGFPKSMDVSKAIDKAARGVPQGGTDPTSVNHGKFKTQGTEGKRHEGDVGQGFGAGPGQFMAQAGETIERELVAEAEQWEGWGTALKPAWEPIIMARKPLGERTVAANVLAHRTGAINIDATRIAGTPESPGSIPPSTVDGRRGSMAGAMDRVEYDATKGRWPANVLLTHDEECGDGCVDDCPVHLLDKQTGIQKSGTAVQRNGGGQAIFGGIAGGENTMGARPDAGYGDSGGASRFFYSSKVGKKERNAGLEATNTHPTVKPVAVMRWLVKMVTPPGGTACDPFMGSGSTGIACVQERFGFIGIDNDTENGYFDIAKARIRHAIQERHA